MLRMRFEKTGDAVWISHLDLMKLLQRAFRRAGFQVKHTEGFSPHAYVSLALPLSVGTSSRCELLEFDLEAADVPLDELPARMNAVLPAGIHFTEAYEGGKKLKDLRWLRVKTVLEYDEGVPEGLIPALTALFASETLPVEKKSKSGLKEIDLKALLHSIEARPLDGRRVELEAVGQAQEPPLNPDLLVKAIERHAPELAPDFAKSERLAIYDANFMEFR